MTKLTYQNQDQRHKYHHLMTTLHLTLKMTTAQVVETSVTNNSLSEDYSTQTITWDKQLNEDSLLDSRWLPLRLLKRQSPTTNSLSKDYPHPDDHAKHIIQNSIIQSLLFYYSEFLREIPGRTFFSKKCRGSGGSWHFTRVNGADLFVHRPELLMVSFVLSIGLLIALAVKRREHPTNMYLLLAFVSPPILDLCHNVLLAK